MRNHERSERHEKKDAKSAGGGEVHEFQEEHEERRMTQRSADKHGRGQLAHPRVSASSAVKLVLVPAEGQAGNFVVSLFLCHWIITGAAT
jgi:hypothetical protein